MKQAKKIITRMLINNWGGISHRMMEFHEYVNLFSGKSGSGKSTVMDAVQVVLYGSVSASFLNKAADDAKNRRSVMSYLRGAQKDGTSNRADQDFYSTLVLEVKDNKTAIVYANKKLLGLFACKNMAELTDFAWEKLFSLTTGLSGDHAEFEHMTVADAKGQEHMLNA